MEYLVLLGPQHMTLPELLDAVWPPTTHTIGAPVTGYCSLENAHAGHHSFPFSTLKEFFQCFIFLYMLIMYEIFLGMDLNVHVFNEQLFCLPCHHPRN